MLGNVLALLIENVWTCFSSTYFTFLGDFYPLSLSARAMSSRTCANNSKYKIYMHDIISYAGCPKKTKTIEITIVKIE
jgi:hypothetical protein